MRAPDILYSELNWISMNLPNRDELLFRSVRALPKASSSGLDASTCRARRAKRCVGTRIDRRAARGGVHQAWAALATTDLRGDFVLIARLADDG